MEASPKSFIAPAVQGIEPITHIYNTPQTSLSYPPTHQFSKLQTLVFFQLFLPETGVQRGIIVGFTLVVPSGRTGRRAA